MADREDPPPLPDGPPEEKPPTLSKAPPKGRQFPCVQCGARLDFDPSQRALACPYCGHAEEIDPGNEVVERDLLEQLAELEDSPDGHIEGRDKEVRCGGCGAAVLLDGLTATDACPYCATHLEGKPEAAHALIPPESLLPFAVDKRAADECFRGWLKRLWFAPSSLRELANLGRLTGVYVPFWTYDAMTYSRYTGMRGDYYYVSQTYTDSDGKTKTRMVRRTRWSYVSGEVQHFFDDVLICASESLPPHLVGRMTNWDLKNLEGFRPDYLSGFQTERYAVGLADGYGRAKRVMAETIDRLCRRDIGGDEQRVHDISTQHVGVTFKHILLPLWSSAYRYKEKRYSILVNGRSGEVAGDRPWSWWKILRLALLIAAVGAAIFFAVRAAQSPGGGPKGIPADDLKRERAVPALPGPAGEAFRTNLIE